MYKYVLITDYPAPWREKVYELVSHQLGASFHVVYCTDKEKRRRWTFEEGTHAKTFLPRIVVRSGEKERYFNPGIVPFVLRHRPRVLIGFGLQPTVLVGLAVGRLLGSRLVVFSDSWVKRDRGISTMQRFARWFVYNYLGDAFLGASVQTLNLFRHYRPSIRESQLFLSGLCADNEYFRQFPGRTELSRKYDIVFSGRIVKEKNPLFFAAVASRLRQKVGRCSALILGDGDRELKEEMVQQLVRGEVEFEFPGFIEHARLPRFYYQGRVLLFPTSGDCWGVVLNEGLISGMPAVTSEWTAAAGELIRDGLNGYVLPLDVELWAVKVANLLTDRLRWHRFSEASVKSAGEFTFERAACGILRTIESLDSGIH